MTLPDGLRAIAALLVILPHSIGLFTAWTDPSLPTRLMAPVCLAGGYGVQIFFVLSGFVIAYTVPRRRISVGFSANFLARRTVRLDPPYWAAIALFDGYLGLRRLLTRDAVGFPSWQTHLANLFYVQDLLGYGNINVVFWTLCIEVQFYLTFCLLLGLLKFLGGSISEGPRARGHSLVAAVFVGSLIWPMRLVGSDWPVAGTFLPHWFAFLGGAIVWWSIASETPRWFGWGAILATLAIGLGTIAGECLTVAGTEAVLLIAARRNALYRWLNVQPIQVLARLSYSIYLVHVPVIGVVLGLQTRLAPRHEIVSYLLLGLIYLVTVCLALLLNRLVEVPALRLSHRLKRSAPKPTPLDDQGTQAGPGGTAQATPP